MAAIIHISCCPVKSMVGAIHPGSPSLYLETELVRMLQAMSFLNIYIYIAIEKDDLKVKTFNYAIKQVVGGGWCQGVLIWQLKCVRTLGYLP